MPWRAAVGGWHYRVVDAVEPPRTKPTRVIDRRRSEAAHVDHARKRRRRRLLTGMRALMTLGIASAFIVEGMTGARAAWLVGNGLAVVLGLTWLIRRRG